MLSHSIEYGTEVNDSIMQKQLINNSGLKETIQETIH